MENLIKKPPKLFNSILLNADKKDYFEGSNIEKPQSSTPMEMDLRIQADRVVHAINRSISVLSVMAHLPYFLENEAAILKKFCTSGERNFIFYVLNTYSDKSIKYGPGFQTFEGILETIHNIKKTMITSSSHKRKSLLSTVETNLLPDPNLSQIIDFIFENKCLRQVIHEASKPLLISCMVDFIKKLEHLREVAKLKLYVTGSEEQARDRQLREAYKSNMMLTATINDLKQQLENQRQQLGHELQQKVSTFEKYNEKIANIKEEFQITIEKTIHYSERKMMHQCIESEEKQNHLTEDAENITEQFNKLLEDHLFDEKQLRSKRLKTEMQLHNWLIKYDQDIGEKQNEYEILKKQYDDEKQLADDLDDKLDEQEKEYIELMEEKREEEERLYNEMAYHLLVNRSARIIQRAWRDYRERKAAKRKGKKGKKGKGKK